MYFWQQYLRGLEFLHRNPLCHISYYSSNNIIPKYWESQLFISKYLIRNLDHSVYPLLLSYRIKCSSHHINEVIRQHFPLTLPEIGFILCILYTHFCSMNIMFFNHLSMYYCGVFYYRTSCPARLHLRNTVKEIYSLE